MTNKSRVPALYRAMAILDILQKNHHCHVSEIINQTGLPRSTVYVIIDEMVNLGLIRRNHDSSVQLWMKLISLGNSAAESLDLKDVVNPHLEYLLQNIDCLAVHFGIMDGDRAYYVIKKTSPKAGVRIMSREGAEISLVHAGLGKCLLAFQSSDLRERIISSIDYTPVTSTSITSPEALRRELASIRLQGWAFDNSEGEAEIRCVAVPVFDHERNLLGAISVVGSVNKFTKEVISIVVDKAKKCALDITDSLML